MKWKCCDFKKTKKFLEMYINYNYKNQKIFIDQSKYLDKVLVYFNITTNLTSTPLLLSYVFKPNNKQYNPSFHQKYHQLVRSLIYLIIRLYSNMEFIIVNLA